MYYPEQFPAKLTKRTLNPTKIFRKSKKLKSLTEELQILPII